MKHFLFLFLSIVSIHVAQACNCPPLKPISKKQCDQYSVIFEGKVDSVSACKGKYAFVYFAVDKSFTGEVYEHTELRFDCSTSCQLSFTKGDKWLIYANYYHYGKLGVYFCGRSRRFFSDSTKDYFTQSSLISYKTEINFLQTTYGTHPILHHPVIGQDDLTMRKRLDIPSEYDKVWLLIISLLVVGVIYLLTKKFLK